MGGKTAFKTALQGVILVLALIPIVTGIIGLVQGPSYMGVPRGLGGADLDSQVRFFSAIFFGVGLSLWSVVPGIERNGARLRGAAALIVLGGLGRLISLGVAGRPATGYLGGIGMELCVTPLIVLWQARVAASASRGRG
jgi:hypothetical protein